METEAAGAVAGQANWLGVRDEAWAATRPTGGWGTCPGDLSRQFAALPAPAGGSRIREAGGGGGERQRGAARKGKGGQ